VPGHRASRALPYLLIIRDPALATQYTKNWDAHRQHSQPYVGRGVRQ
jgi:hypothetical protein